MSSPQLIQNPLIPSSIDGAVTTANRTNLFQIDLRAFASSSARLSLTNLSGDANLRVLRGTTEIQASKNEGRLSESILLGPIGAPLAPDLYTIEVTLADGAASANYKLNVAVNANASLSNIWWRNSAAAQAAIWRMDGINRRSSEAYSSIPAEWEVQGVDDLNGDGEDDLLWRNMNTGDVAYWLFKDGVRVDSGISFGNAVPLDWKIVALKDLDGDNNADLVWQNANQGLIGLWTLKAGKFVSSGTINTGSNWQPLSAAYLDSDTKADFVLRDAASGEIALWKLDGTRISQGRIIKTGTSWVPQFYGDINGDKQEDIIFRDTSGAVAFWHMDGVNIIQSWATEAISQDWQIERVGNFDGTANGGNKDLLWRNRRSGEMAIWLFNAQGTGFSDRKIVTLDGAAYSKGANWTISGVGDFNNDGRADIVYRSEQQAIVEVLQMNGTMINAANSLSGVSTDWKVRGIMKREINSEPFDISERLTNGGFSNTLAFDMGTIEGTAGYVDTVRASFDDYFKFSTNVRSNIRLDLLNSPNVQVELFPILANGSLGTALTYSQDMALGIGSYAVRVFTQQAGATSYDLKVFGQPESTDVASVSFTTATNTFALNPSAGGLPNTITTSFRVRNNGSTAINNIEVGFRISRDRTISLDAGSTDAPLEVVDATGDKTIFTLSTPLDPGQERQFDNVQLVLPKTDGAFWFVDGKYTIGMVVDPNNKLTEANETNNLNGEFGKDRIELTIEGTETTEVQGTSMTLTSGSFTPGGKVTVEFTVASIGNKSLSAGSKFPIEFWLSPDPTITEEDAPVGTFIVENPNSALAPLSGAGDTNQNDGVSPTRTFTIELTLPNPNWSGWSSPTGTTFYLSSWIDPLQNGIIGEVDVINNKFDPNTLATPETDDDTIGKNALTFVR